jgi:hypothetical protein
MPKRWQRDKEWQAKWEGTVSEKKLAQKKVDKDNLTQRIKSEKEEMGCFLRGQEKSEEEYRERLQRKGYRFWKEEKEQSKREKVTDKTSRGQNGASSSFTCDLAAAGKRNGRGGRYLERLGNAVVP